MTRRNGGVAAGVALIVALASCSVEPGVEVEQSNEISGRPSPPSEAPGGMEEVDLPPSADLPIIDAPASAVNWGDCAGFAIPSTEALGTAGWQCAVLEVPMDPFGDEPTTGVVELALTRHPATGDRRGALVLNPGGPGGAGLDAAWGTRGSMPAELLRAFDIVSWDPRGVGQSTPGVECDSRLGPGEVEFIARCVELTGPVSAFLSAPYSAADMEAIRVALGEDELNYLGYSYGSVLGATYAAAHPDHVGAFVLDGVTDPRAGAEDGPFSGTFAVFADDGVPAARARFAELCDATPACLEGLDTNAILDGIAGRVAGLPTELFAGQPEQVDEAAFGGFMESVLTHAGDWELAATAIADADRGDASAMAALIAGGADAPPAVDDLDGTDGRTDFAEANYMIYCADFGPLLVDATFCDDMPTNVRRIEPVEPVDIERAMLLIGTAFDPVTPGYHTPDFADAIGDATHIIWEGVGHTVFPGWTSCVDDAVTAQFLRRTVPPDGTRCSFLPGIDDDVTLADDLFDHGDSESLRLLELAIARRDLGDDPACSASYVNDESSRVISHVILDVTSDEALNTLDRASLAC